MANLLAAHTDAAVERLAKAGDKTADAELIRRGLKACPAMVKLCATRARYTGERRDYGWRWRR